MMKIKVTFLFVFLFIWISGYCQDYTEYLPANFKNSQWFNTKSINNSYDLKDTAYYTSRYGDTAITQSKIFQYHKINSSIEQKTEYWYKHKESKYCNLINVYNISDEIHLLQGKCDEEFNDSHENINHFWVYNNRKEFIFDFEINAEGCDPVYSGKKVAGHYYFIVPLDAKKCILVEIDTDKSSLRLRKLTWKGFRFNTRIIGSVQKGGKDYLVINSHFNQFESYNLALIDVENLTVVEQWRSDRNMIGITQAENGDFFILTESNDIDSQHVEFHLCTPDLRAYQSKKMFLAFKRWTNLFFNRTSTTNDKFYFAITNNQNIEQAVLDYVFAFNEELELQRIIVFPFYVANMDIHGNFMTAWNPQSNYAYPIIDYQLDAFNCPTPEICDSTKPTDSLLFSKEVYIESIKTVSYTKNILPKIQKRTSEITYTSNDNCIDENIVIELNMFDDEYCQGEKLNYLAQPITENTYSLQLVDENFNSVISSLEYDQNIYADLAAPGSYYLLLNDEFLGCKLSDTVGFDVHQVPKVDLRTTKRKICRGDSIKITPWVQDYDDYQWKHEQRPIDVSLNPYFDDHGDYDLVLFKGECSNSDRFTLEFYEEIPRGNLFRDTITCEKPRISLRPMSFNHKELKWNTGSEDYYLWIEEEGMYSVKGMFECGESMDTFIVAKEYCPKAQPVYLPNVFTPNGDGVNDLFPQQNFQEIPYELRIFDRWGELVYSCVGINCHWKGNFNAQPALDGVYMYIINLENKNYQGSITLMR